MEYMAAIIFFAVVLVGGAFLWAKKPEKSSPVKGGGGTMPEGEGETDGSLAPKSGPAAE